MKRNSVSRRLSWLRKPTPESPQHLQVLAALVQDYLRLPLTDGDNRRGLSMKDAAQNAESASGVALPNLPRCEVDCVGRRLQQPLELERVEGSKPSEQGQILAFW